MLTGSRKNTVKKNIQAPHPRATAIYQWAKQPRKENSGGLFEKLGLIEDTVGAVAIDSKGSIAAGVSTGGQTTSCPEKQATLPYLGQAIEP